MLVTAKQRLEAQSLTPSPQNQSCHGATQLLTSPPSNQNCNRATHRIGWTSKQLGGRATRTTERGRRRANFALTKGEFETRCPQSALPIARVLRRRKFRSDKKGVGPLWPLQAPPTAHVAKNALICIFRRAEFGRAFNDAQCVAQSCNLKVSPTPPSTQTTQDARIEGASYVKRGPRWTLVNNPGRQVANRRTL